MLAYVDDERYRRRILTQLNRRESRHSVAVAVFHGQRGELRPLRDPADRSEDDEWEMGVA